MSASIFLPPDLPKLSELGLDLLQSGRPQILRLFLRPVFCGLAFIGFVWLAWWPLAILSASGLFMYVVFLNHDLIHNTLRLPRWLNEWLIAVVPALVLSSGHAFQVSHLQHHRRFPLDDDPEGDAARWSWWRALLEGVIFPYKIWWWAWGRASTKRKWLALEAAWFVAFWITALILWPKIPALTIYAGLMNLGNWIVPLATVHLPHNPHGADALTQTRTVRGFLIPAIFLDQTYHLEHHLYPSVPSHNYTKLAARLDAYFQRKKVAPIKVW